MDDVVRDEVTGFGPANNRPARIELALLDKCSVVEVARAEGATVEDVYAAYLRLRSSGVITWSPYSLVQERVRGSSDYPWKVIVLCALMNRTHARQVRPIMGELFSTWANPYSMSCAGRALENLIRPLGFYNQRAKTLRRMSEDYAQFVHVEKCRGVGQFGRDAVRIFVYGECDFEPNDGFLGKYVRWRRSGEVLFDKT